MPSHSANRIASLGEEALVARLVAGLVHGPSVIAGPGDDCAVVTLADDRWQLLKTDSIVESVHFAPGTDPIRVGRKAFNRALSDIAAMGGTPSHALVSLALDECRELTEVEGWYAGIIGAARSSGCDIVGGETSRLPGVGAVITLSMTGFVAPPDCVLRSGAKIGDGIWVTGRLGGSFASGRHLDFTPRLREAQWLVRRSKPTAMMDLSDGLGSDLPRLAAASGVGYQVNLDAIPCHEGVAVDRAISEGEDYELLFTLSPEQESELSAKWPRQFPDTTLTRIGEIVADTITPLPRAWEHFRQG